MDELARRKHQKMKNDRIKQLAELLELDKTDEIQARMEERRVRVEEGEGEKV